MSCELVITTDNKNAMQVATLLSSKPGYEEQICYQSLLIS